MVGKGELGGKWAKAGGLVAQGDRHTGLRQKRVEDQHRSAQAAQQHRLRMYGFA